MKRKAAQQVPAMKSGRLTPLPLPTATVTMTAREPLKRKFTDSPVKNSIDTPTESAVKRSRTSDLLSVSLTSSSNKKNESNDSSNSPSRSGSVKKVAVHTKESRNLEDPGSRRSSNRLSPVKGKKDVKEKNIGANTQKTTKKEEKMQREKEEKKQRELKEKKKRDKKEMHERETIRINKQKYQEEKEAKKSAKIAKSKEIEKETKTKLKEKTQNVSSQVQLGRPIRAAAVVAAAAIVIGSNKKSA